MCSNKYFNIRNVCPVCFSDESTELVKVPYSQKLIKSYLEWYYHHFDYSMLEGANYILDQCGLCGLIYQREVPCSFFMEKIYEEWIDPHQSFELTLKYELKYYKKLNKHIQLMIAYMGGIPSRLNVLDFGLGWGLWAKMAMGYGLNVYGVELSQSRINHARKLGVNIVTYEDIPGMQFDFINTTQVFEHLAEPTIVLKYITQGLKKNGIIRISVPSGRRINEKLKKEDWTQIKWHLKGKDDVNSLNSVAPLEHINCFTPQSLIAMSDKAGLSLINVALDKHENILKRTLKHMLRPYHRSLRALFMNNKKKMSEYYIKN